MVSGLNHLTLAVADLDRSLAFYTGLLGFRPRARTSHSAYLEAGAFWLALVVDDSPGFKAVPNGYSHIALTVPIGELGGMRERLMESGVRCWQESERKDSFYFCDLDDHQLELHAGDLESRLSETR